MYNLLLGFITVCTSPSFAGVNADELTHMRTPLTVSDTNKVRPAGLYSEYRNLNRREQLGNAGINLIPVVGFPIEWTSGQRTSQDSNYTISRSNSSGNADLLMISPSGNVGIGTLVPGNYKLAVEGTIGARKLQVKMDSWADYVFQPGYRLPTLEQVESFIRQHGRLPEVPSAKEVSESGIDVGANQALLLKKIEELTLYMIQLKKENEQLCERLTKLERDK